MIDEKRDETIDIRLLPSERYEYKVSVMALCAGRLPFPKLIIRSSMFDSTILDEISRLSIPDTIFILSISDDSFLELSVDPITSEIEPLAKSEM
ncbi:hypothetical protein X798_06057 [Onchocerca flexuosa]|uniref:Uncharacterized protein n=1 Tax=Onchocerca flexuosa TaxID=387005 RepID=A0A238BQK9_9BILA|nr:hypothetical protein X798_06057 [Onchocerca flexuosa]